MITLTTLGAGSTMAIESPPLRLPYSELNYAEPVGLEGVEFRVATIEEVRAWWGSDGGGEAACGINEPFACGPDVEVGQEVEVPEEPPAEPFPSVTGYRSACRYYSDTYYTCCYYNDEGRMTQCYEYSKSCYRSNGRTYCYYRAREYYCGG